MGFTCYLCGEETVYTKYYCPACEKIKRIINVYSKDKVLEILEKVCLRKSEKLQNYKINDIKKEIENDDKDLGDSSYLPCPKNNKNNPNNEVLNELKKKLNK